MTDDDDHMCRKTLARCDLQEGGDSLRDGGCATISTGRSRSSTRSSNSNAPLLERGHLTVDP